MFGKIEFARQLRNLGLILLAVMVTPSAIPIERSADNNNNNPCSTGNGEAETQDFAVILGNLKTNTAGVKLSAQDIKHTAGEMISQMGLGDRLSKLDKYSFIEPFSTDIVAEEELESIFDKEALLMSHWSHMFNITTLVNFARTHGQLGQSGFDDNSSEANLRNQLDHLELLMDGVVCNIYEGLLSQGVSQPTTPEYTMPNNFGFEGASLRHELYRVYILMGDVAMVTGHLNSVYNTM